MSLEAVADMAMALPEVSEADRRGQRTWSVGGRTFAWERAFSKADIRRFGEAPPPEGPIVAVRVDDLSEKEAVLAAHPECVFTIPHFDGYAAVLVHLDRARPAVVRDVLLDGWLACAPETLVREYLSRRRSRAPRS